MIVEILLANPVRAGQISAITLRQPTLRDLADCGRPARLIEGDAVRYVKIDFDALARLIRRCVITPAEPEAWIDEVGFADTYALIDEFIQLWHATEKAAARLPINR